MVTSKNLKEKNKNLESKAKKIKLVLTDNDGVLTDTGVYYSEDGEELKRFSIRDGMGVERLRELVNIKTSIITGELSGSVKKRAEKLKINELYLGAKKKHLLLEEILTKNNLKAENVAVIGDDINDIELMKIAGFTAAPSDAMPEVVKIVDYVCKNRGGNGAFREFAELLISFNIENNN
jgi:3-deoxy-D-manno-octulosonate 8-phosphate phosphatase (KDO 8-P phosphatase)